MSWSAGDSMLDPNETAVAYVPEAFDTIVGTS